MREEFDHFYTIDVLWYNLVEMSEIKGNLYSPSALNCHGLRCLISSSIKQMLKSCQHVLPLKSVAVYK